MKVEKIFLMTFFLIISMGFLTIIREPKLISTTENRGLNQFSLPNYDSFVQKSYQDNLELALSDQFIGSETIKKTIQKTKKIINYNNIPKIICEKEYVKVSDDNDYIYNCEKFLVTKGEGVVSQQTEKRINYYNYINSITDAHYYVVNRSTNFDFLTNKYTFDIEKHLNESLEGDFKVASLQIKDFNDYKNYFYKTDHHWNYKGSYQGYLDILKLLNIEDKKRIPTNEIKFDNLYFFGSLTRSSSIYDFKEEFTVYDFELPKYTTYINGQKATYGNKEEYLNGRYDTNQLANHYANFYGGDPAELIIDFSQKNKDNILIMGTSYTNALNVLVASHFNKTYVIDIRHYYETFNENFNVKKYIKDNDIDKVLIIDDIRSIVDLNGIEEVE